MPRLATSLEDDDLRVFSLEEARRRLGGISRATIYNLRARGEITFVHVGARPMVPASEIRRLIEGR